jgi:hypothetical protein
MDEIWRYYIQELRSSIIYIIYNKITPSMIKPQSYDYFLT